MNKRQRYTRRLTFIFSLAVFLIMSITMFLMGGITLILYNIGILNIQSHKLPIVFFAVVSVLIGTVFSRFFGKRIIASIEEISKATKEVSKGNFNIRLDEENTVDEISTMARNFNIMTKELKNTEMLRSDFINNVSHEFKTPLSAIEGYATLLQKKSLSAEKREAYADKIIHSTRRLNSLTGNILELSKLEHHEININRKTYALDEQLREIILMFEDEWSDKKLDLDVDLDSVNYYGNVELLGQVWQNLISNAIKFVGENGNIKITLRKSFSSISVTIMDDGIGIERQIQERIFEKFYQEDVSHSTTGNGLGLALVKQIIDLHKGKITVYSEKDKGAKFVVDLPV